MTDRRPQERDRLEAGDFSAWLGAMQAALSGEGKADVPCNGCTACCTSSQFVHIADDEVDTLSRIPAELLFPAPHLPAGHVVLGYDERGHCPMLVDDRCSIYEHRPRTCRTYDCRIFPAAGLAAGLDLDLDDASDSSDESDSSKALIARRARRWRFSYPSSTDTVEQQAVWAAAAFLEEHGGTTDVTRNAVLAIELHDLFLRPDDETGDLAVVAPDPDAIRERLTAKGVGI